jgi:hypothetical protein
MAQNGYQVGKMTEERRAERDRLVGQILEAAHELCAQHMIHFSDLMLEQDAGGLDGDSTRKMNMTFYADHPHEDYRLQLTMVVRAKDR